jgi:hypothetical protein
LDLGEGISVQVGVLSQAFAGRADHGGHRIDHQLRAV